jgi:hypothetical protein
MVCPCIAGAFWGNETVHEEGGNGNREFFGSEVAERFEVSIGAEGEVEEGE